MNTVPLSGKDTKVTISWLPAEVKQWEKPIVDSARRYNLDANFIAIIIMIESGGRPQAVSPVGAQGLMQVMPGTADEIARKYLKKPVQTYDLRDPATNIEFGTAYLAYLRDTFGAASQGPSWDVTAKVVSAGYNGGPGAAQRLVHGQGLEYQETILYSQKAVQLWQSRSQAKVNT